MQKRKNSKPIWKQRLFFLLRYEVEREGDGIRRRGEANRMLQQRYQSRYITQGPPKLLYFKKWKKVLSRFESNYTTLQWY